MSSGTTRNTQSGLKNSRSERVLTIDWSLLIRRMRMRFSQLFRSAKHRASQTEYTPPAWASNFKLGWFRIGLIGLAIFVFTQKQIDFTVSVGKAGLGIGERPVMAANCQNPSVVKTSHAAANVAQMSVIPGSSGPAAVEVVKANWSVEQYDVATVRSYINRFERVAKTEQEKYGIPAAAKLAIAILESEAGTAPKTVENNNHFGVITSNGFYANAWANWRAHSEYMSTTYPELLHASMGTKQWIDALSSTDYSRDARFGEKLLAIIKYFNL